MHPEYLVTIGIEVHVQVKTESKIFCPSPNNVTQAPNTHICPICIGQPGVLPALNKEVIKAAVMAGLATHSTIHPVSEFARKHYFYPDLPKNYQITQHDRPICTEGYITVTDESGTKSRIRLIRIHIEEDAGKSLHAPDANESFVDLNRTGTPLLEIVSYPDITSSAQARAYLKALRNIIVYLGISTGNMEEGAFRADTNISVRKKDSTVLGTRCELKNINSFKFIGDAIEYEIERQIALLEAGERVKQETRSWDTKEHKTTVLRTKEEAADYRYFPDPDLPLVTLDQTYIDSIRTSMPELPEAKAERLEKQYGLSSYEIDILINEPDIADYFEQAAQIYYSKQLINWVLRDVMRSIKEHKLVLADYNVTPEKLAELTKLLDDNSITNRVAQDVFALIAKTGKSPTSIVKEQKLEQVGSIDELEQIIKEIITHNPEQVAAYKAGKDKLFGFFVGQVMQKTQGRANPQITNELLVKNLAK